MCPMIMNPTAEPTTNALSIRQGALLMRRNRVRMNSFCLPKETTSALLQAHFDDDDDCDHDEPENDCTATTTCTADAPEMEQPMNRRKMALVQRRTKQRMTSFRLPADKTQQLLLLNDADFSNSEEGFVESEPATITTPEPRADNMKLRRVRALQNHKVKARRNFFCLPKENTSALLQMNNAPEDEEVHQEQEQQEPQQQQTSEKNRRCQALRQHTRKMRLNSFCLPKETTPQLLQMMATYNLEDDEEEESAQHRQGQEQNEDATPISEKNRRCQALKQHTRKMRLRSFRLVPKENTKDLLHWTNDDDTASAPACAEDDDDDDETAFIPRPLIRQSSFSARSA